MDILCSTPTCGGWRAAQTGAGEKLRAKRGGFPDGSGGRVSLLFPRLARRRTTCSRSCCRIVRRHRERCNFMLRSTTGKISTLKRVDVDAGEPPDVQRPGSSFSRMCRWSPLFLISSLAPLSPSHVVQRPSRQPDPHPPRAEAGWAVPRGHSWQRHTRLNSMKWLLDNRDSRLYGRRQPPGYSVRRCALHRLHYCRGRALPCPSPMSRFIHSTL